jgi:hypothetical protein
MPRPSPFSCPECGTGEHVIRYTFNLTIAQPLQILKNATLRRMQKENMQGFPWIDVRIDQSKGGDLTQEELEVMEKHRSVSKSKFWSWVVKRRGVSARGSGSSAQWAFEPNGFEHVTNPEISFPKYAWWCKKHKRVIGHSDAGRDCRGTQFPSVFTTFTQALITPHRSEDETGGLIPNFRSLRLVS